MQGEQAYAKFKAPIETGLQTKMAECLWFSLLLLSNQLTFQTSLLDYTVNEKSTFTERKFN